MKMLTKAEDIEAWIEQYSNIKHYELIASEQYGFVVNVPECVNFYGRDLKHIPIKFNEVDGHFDCSHNQLISLEFCPNFVGNYFDCSFNQLTSLKGCPEIVRYYFNCSCNIIENLDHLPLIVHDEFMCHDNSSLSEFEFMRNLDEIKKLKFKKNLEQKIILPFEENLNIGKPKI